MTTRSGGAAITPSRGMRIRGELSRAAGAQEGLDLVGGAGRGEEIALAHAAAAVGEKLALRVVLDALRHHLEVQAAGERDEGAREPRALGIARHAGDQLP